jgi:hypothetical protein
MDNLLIGEGDASRSQFSSAGKRIVQILAESQFFPEV